ncbi:hypothetical protein D3C83_108170 [compost metagenome]
MAQAVRASIHFLVADCFAFVPHRHRLGTLLNLLLDQLLNALLSRILAAGLIPLAQQLLPLGGLQYFQLPDGPARLCHDASQ